MNGHGSPVLFREEQQFRQWWLWLILWGVAAVSWWGFYEQIVRGRPWGSNPGPDWVIWLTWLLAGCGLPLLFWRLKLVVEVQPREVLIDLQPLVRRAIPLAEIERVEKRAYRPLRDYGGWGIKGWSLRSIAYNVSGNQGVELTLGDGRRVMLGSARAAALAGAIESARSA
jgi:hypothetical protein